MWFKLLTLAFGVALLGKATMALAFHQRFYAARQLQYSSALLPAKLLVGPILAIALACTAWYATLFQYRPWGWVITSFLTLLAAMSVDHLWRWRSNSTSDRTSQWTSWLHALHVTLMVGAITSAIVQLRIVMLDPRVANSTKAGRHDSIIGVREPSSSSATVSQHS